MTYEEKILLNEGKMLPVMEHFYTLQGEGFHAGKAAYFIRIGGCDVGCHWCDVKESWNAEIHPLADVEKIAEIAAKFSKIVVLTGGEPLMYNLKVLTHKLKNLGCKIHIETSGSHELKGIADWLTLSPKKLSLPKNEIYAKTNELKVIIFNYHDFAFAEQQAEKVPGDCKLFLQAEWSRHTEMYPKISDYIMKNPKWQISVQIHKYLNIP